MKIGQKLKLLRKLKNYTQEEFAEKINMTRRSYANLENDSTKIDLSRLTEIAKAYGIELDELLSLNESHAFNNCFNKNTNGFFTAEKIYSGVTNDEREYFMQQMKLLVNSFNDERKVFMEVIVNFKKLIKKID